METGQTPTRPSKGWLRPGLLGLGLGVALAGAAGLAWASGLGPGAFCHGHPGRGLMRDHVEFRIHRALKEVNASEAQEERILAVVGTLFAQHEQMAGVHHEMHQRALAALTADPIDRAALEAVRTEAIGRVDECSKDLVKAAADIAEVLTPDQRRQLAELARARFE